MIYENDELAAIETDDVSACLLAQYNLKLCVIAHAVELDKMTSLSVTYC